MNPLYSRRGLFRGLFEKHGFSDDYFCPDNWIKFGQQCYLPSVDAKSWLSAAEDCHSNGSSLASFNHGEESAFLSGTSLTWSSSIGSKMIPAEMIGTWALRYHF